jgi:hypothetical protein
MIQVSFFRGELDADTLDCFLAQRLRFFRLLLHECGVGWNKFTFGFGAVELFARLQSLVSVSEK